MLDPNDPLVVARLYRNSDLSLGDVEHLEEAIALINSVEFDLEDYGLQPQRLNRVADLRAKLSKAFDCVLLVLDPPYYYDNKGEGR